MGRGCSIKGRGKTCLCFSCGNLCERGHLGDTGVDGRIILRWVIRKMNVEVWTGSSFLGIGTSGGHWWMRL